MSDSYGGFITQITKGSIQFSDDPSKASDVLYADLLPDLSDLSADLLSEVYSFEYFSGTVAELLEITNYSEYLSKKNQKFLEKFPVNENTEHETLLRNLTIRKVHELLSASDPLIFEFYANTFRAIASNPFFSSLFRYISDKEVTSYSVRINRMYIVDFFITFGERIENIITELDKLEKAMAQLGKSLSQPIKITEMANLVARVKQEYKNPDNLRRILQTYDKKLQRRVQWCEECAQNLVKHYNQLASDGLNSPSGFLNLYNIVDQALCAFGSVVNDEINAHLTKIKRIVGENPIFLASMVAFAILTPFGISLTGFFSGGKSGTRNFTKAIKDVKRFFKDFESMIKTNPSLAPVAGLYNFLDKSVAYTNLAASTIGYIYNTATLLDNLTKLVNKSNKAEDFLKLICNIATRLTDLLILAYLFIPNSSKQNNTKNQITSNGLKSSEQISAVIGKTAEIKAESQTVIPSEVVVPTEKFLVQPQKSEQVVETRKVEEETVSSGGETSTGTASLVNSISKIQFEKQYVSLEPASNLTYTFKIISAEDENGKVVPVSNYSEVIKIDNFLPRYNKVFDLSILKPDEFHDTYKRVGTWQDEQLLANNVEMTEEGVNIRLNKSSLKNKRVIQWPINYLKTTVWGKSKEETYNNLSELTLTRAGFEHVVELESSYIKSNLTLLRNIKFSKETEMDVRSISPSGNFLVVYKPGKLEIYTTALDADLQPQLFLTVDLPGYTQSGVVYEIRRLIKFIWRGERNFELLLECKPSAPGLESQFVVYSIDFSSEVNLTYSVIGDLTRKRDKVILKDDIACSLEDNIFVARQISSQKVIQFVLPDFPEFGVQNRLDLLKYALNNSEHLFNETQRLLYPSLDENWLVIYQYDRLYVLSVSNLITYFNNQSIVPELEVVDLPSHIQPTVQVATLFDKELPESALANAYLINPRIRWLRYTEGGDLKNLLLVDIIYPYGNILALYTPDTPAGTVLLNKVNNHPYIASISGIYMAAPLILDAAGFVDLLGDKYILIVGTDENGTNLHALVPDWRSVL